MRTVLTIISSELVMPCDPMPLSLKPWKGKWSGPRAGALFTCSQRGARLRHTPETPQVPLPRILPTACACQARQGTCDSVDELPMRSIPRHAAASPEGER